MVIPSNSGRPNLRLYLTRLSCSVVKLAGLAAEVSQIIVDERGPRGKRQARRPHVHGDDGMRDAAGLVTQAGVGKRRSVHTLGGCAERWLFFNRRGSVCGRGFDKLNLKVGVQRGRSGRRKAASNIRCSTQPWQSCALLGRRRIEPSSRLPKLPAGTWFEDGIGRRRRTGRVHA